MVKDRNASPIVLVFDVNETLLDVKKLQPHFERLFHDGAILKEWFAHMLLYSQTLTQVGSYADFGKLAGAALQMTAEIHGVALTGEDISAVTQSMRSLPAHPDIPTALSRLKGHGFRLFALTNSAEEVTREQIENAGLTALFERVLSVGAVRKYKPVNLHQKLIGMLRASLGLRPLASP
jgi:2-haloacid dehalogenase